MSYKYNAKPSPEDKNDYVITRLKPVLTTYPDKFQVSFPGIVKDQGEIGSCVAHSGSYLRESEEAQQSGAYKQFSVGFIYGNRLSTDSQDEGMIPREMLKQLASCGDVLYTDFPYNEDYPTVKAKIDADKQNLLAKAYPYRISAYCKLNNTNEMKSALMQLGAITICCPIYDSFESDEVAKTGVVPMPDTTKEQLMGYHELTVFGWTNDSHWIVLNSWSSSWGDKGYCYIPFDYPIQEAWSVTDNILPNPSPNPDDHKFYRVQSNAYVLKTCAMRLYNKLVNDGYKPSIEVVGKKYVVQAGAFVNETDANKLLVTLLSKKYKMVVNYY